MANLLKRLSGPYFDFLVGPQGEWYTRCHPKRRTMVLKKECFHNRDAICVPMDVMELAADCLSVSHPRFNYYGDTEYTGENLEALIACLSARVDALRFCRCKREFDALTPDIFKESCRQHLARRHRYWHRVRNQAVACLDEVLRYAQDAQRPENALLVLGV